MLAVFKDCLRLRVGRAGHILDKVVGLTVPQEEEWYRFAIQDNGPGIAPKDHGRIFQIFQTLHAGDEYGSTGIGLTLVKKIVELHGGQIQVFSPLPADAHGNPVPGTLFEFTLPRRAVPLATDD